MEVNQLIKNVNTKIKKNINCEEVKIVDKTYLHKKHSTHQLGKFHFHHDLDIFAIVFLENR